MSTRQKDSFITNIMRVIQIYSNDKTSVNNISKEYPNFTTSLASLITSCKDNVVDNLCKDIVINFVRNGKVVPRELYMLIENDENALLNREDSRQSDKRPDKRPMMKESVERLSTEEIGVQCSPAQSHR